MRFFSKNGAAVAPQNTHLPLQSPVGMLWIHQRDTGWVVVVGKPVWDHALVICNREFYQLVRGGVGGGGVMVMGSVG